MYKKNNVLKSIILLITVIFITACTSKIDLNDNKSEDKSISYEDISASVEEYYFYGNHFNINGYIETSVTNIEKVLFVLEGNKKVEYELKYDREANRLNYYASKTLNEGFYFDDLDIDNYNMYISIIGDTYIKNFYLKNNTNYPNTTYYTVTKNGINYKILVEGIDKMGINVVETNNEKFYDIVLDPGHGGSDKGACYSNAGPCETDYTLSVCQSIKKQLEQLGYKVFITRNTDSYLAKYGTGGRVNIAAASKAKLLLSIHLNSNTSNKYHGFEFYTSYNIGYDFANSFANNILKVDNASISNNPLNSVGNGVYTRTFDVDDVNNVKRISKNNYDVSTTTNYYFVIRETGGYMTGAYTDGKYDEDEENFYRNSNVGLESYIYEMAYINNKSDLDLFKKNKDKYIEMVVKTIDERFKNNK